MTTTATQPDVPERDCEYPTTATFPNAQRTGVAVAARRSALLAHGFFAAAVAIVPWTVYLAVTLPKHYSAHFYWFGWTGFDVALVVALVITGRALRHGDVSVHRYASVVATMLVVDAWFNVLNANTRADRLAAVAMAALVELPLAFVCWRIARREVAAVLLVPAQDESDWLDQPRSRAGLRRLPPPGGLH